MEEALMKGSPEDYLRLRAEVDELDKQRELAKKTRELQEAQPASARMTSAFEKEMANEDTNVWEVARLCESGPAGRWRGHEAKLREAAEKLKDSPMAIPSDVNSVLSMLGRASDDPQDLSYVVENYDYSENDFISFSGMLQRQVLSEEQEDALLENLATKGADQRAFRTAVSYVAERHGYDVEALSRSEVDLPAPPPVAGAASAEDAKLTGAYGYEPTEPAHVRHAAQARFDSHESAWGFLNAGIRALERREASAAEETSKAAVDARLAPLRRRRTAALYHMRNMQILSDVRMFRNRTKPSA